MTGARLPRRVFRQGTDPDPRFTLANGRTFLAWLRTSLALFATAVALEAVQLPSANLIRAAASGLLLVTGLAAAARAWFGWMASERALRTGAPLPGLASGGVVAAGVGLAMVLVGIGILL